MATEQEKQLAKAMFLRGWQAGYRAALSPRSFESAEQSWGEYQLELLLVAQAPQTGRL